MGTPAENRSGVLQVDVGPVDKRRPERFRGFLQWLRTVFFSRKYTTAAEEAHEYVEQVKSAGLAGLRARVIRNAHLEAEISQRMAESAKVCVEGQKEMMLFDDEREFLRAQTAKIRAEAETLVVDARLKSLETLDRLGFEVLPVFREGQLDGLYVAKVSREHNTRMVPERDKKTAEEVRPARTPVLKRRVAKRGPRHR